MTCSAIGRRRSRTPRRGSRSALHYRLTSNSAPSCRADPHATRSTILRIRAACLDLTGTTTGQLLAWVRLTDATWIALVDFTATTGNRRGHLPMRQWVPARAVRPK